MSTATLQRPRQPHRSPPSRSNFAGTVGLLRLYLRRDRIVAPLWISLLSVPLATVYVGSVERVYPTQADRAAFAASIMASPAQRAMYGNVYNDSLGAVGIWKAGIFHVFIAVAVILAVIRHTRAEEENGRTELIDSAAVGRFASLTAALALACGASMLTGLIGIAGLLILDIPAAGSLAFGLALAASGMVFTAVAAVSAQLSPSARFARGVAFSVLGGAFALRAVGDASGSALSWLSPLGWSLQVKPFAGDHFWVLVLNLATTIGLVAAAYWLLSRRDVGAGMIADRLGAGDAGPALRGVLSLGWRLDRGTLLVWTVGMGMYGLVIGGVAHGVGNELGSSTAIRDLVARLGGTGVLEQAFIAVSFSMLGMATSALAISLVLRLHHEESDQRAEAIMAGAVSRIRWLTSHVVPAILGSTAALLIAGVAAGMAYGAAVGDIGGTLPRILGTAAVQLPAVWLPAAVGVVLFGLVPRFTPLTWAVLVGFIALFMIGSLTGAPQPLLDLVPFMHTPRIGTAGFSVIPLVWLSAVDIALITLGAIAFRRRDLR